MTKENTQNAAGPLAKGSNLVGLLAAVEERFGGETHDRLIAALPTEIAEAVREGGIVVSGWYPLGWYRILHRQAQAVTGCDHRLAFELAHLFVRQQLGGIYKALLLFISPHWLFHYPKMIFSRYFSTGSLVISESRPGFVRGKWSGCEGFDRNIWNATFGGCQAALEAAGAKEVRIEVVSGGGDGDEAAEATGTWGR